MSDESAIQLETDVLNRLARKVGRQETQTIAGSLGGELREEDNGEELMINWSEHFGESGLPDRLKGRYKKLRHFCRSVAVGFRSRFNELANEYSQKNPKFSEQISRKLRLRGHNLPFFDFYFGDEARTLLENLGKKDIDDWMEKYDLYMIFQLPRPVARFWYKGKGDDAADIWEKVPEGEIEWGFFYRQVMPTVWEEIDKDSDYGLKLLRLNPSGKHDAKKYYYVYGVGDAKAN